MKELTDVDVLICGAGAAGLTLAIDLARRGISFRLIEKSAHAFAGSRGKGIQPRSLEMLEDFGIVDRIFAAGGDYPADRHYRADGSFHDASIVEQRAPTPAEPYQTPLMVAQFKTEAILRECLLELGHKPEFACELMVFKQDIDGVTASLSTQQGDEQIRAKWLVGADGGRSLVRHVLNIDFPGKTLGVRAVVADVVLTGLSRNAWHRFNEADMATMVSFCPLAGTDMFQIQGPIPLHGDIDLSAAGLSALVTERTGRDDIVIQTVSWSSAYVMNARLADRYRVGRVLLVGDAAHIHPPTGGQGLNTSAQDAYNLGWKLAAVIDGAAETLLDTYEEERRPVAAAMLGLATRLLEGAKQGGMQRGREVHQLDIGYAESSLALQNPRRNQGLMAGDRAQDAPIRGAAGRALRVFDLLQGAHWTLLGYEVERSLVFPRKGLHIYTFGVQGELIDDKGHFSKAYSPNVGDWILIRPDGYIGAMLTSANIEALQHYLAQVGLGRLHKKARAIRR